LVLPAATGALVHLILAAPVLTTLALPALVAGLLLASLLATTLVTLVLILAALLAATVSLIVCHDFTFKYSNATTYKKIMPQQG
jgi:hypothetical protein